MFLIFFYPLRTPVLVFSGKFTPRFTFSFRITKNETIKSTRVFARYDIRSSNFFSIIDIYVCLFSFRIDPVLLWNYYSLKEFFSHASIFLINYSCFFDMSLSFSTFSKSSYYIPNLWSNLE